MRNVWFAALALAVGAVVFALASPPLPLLMLVGGVVSGLVGLLTGDLTLRLRGVFFCPEVTRRQL